MDNGTQAGQFVTGVGFRGDRLAGSIGTITFTDTAFSLSGSRVKNGSPSSITASGTYTISGSTLTLNATTQSGAGGGQLSPTYSTVFKGLGTTGVAERARFIGEAANDSGFPCMGTFDIERQ